MAQIQHHLGLLSLLIPLIGIIGGALEWNSAAIFVLNMVALIPLVSWINRSIDALAIGGSRAFIEVLKSTLGNSVELMIGINAIAKRRPHISQSVILGSVLSNLLLVLGSTIFFSGYDQKRLRFDRTLTTVLSSLMMVVFILLALPTIMDVFPSAKATPEDQVLLTQRVTAIILIILLLTFLVFRLGTHAAMFASTPFSQRDHTRNGHQSRQSQIIEARIPQPYVGKFAAAIILTAASSSALACTYYIVSSLSGAAAITGMNQSFLAVTLVPLLGNSIKYRSIVVGSRSYNQIELGIRAVINNVLRVTMLIAPLLVLAGWAFDQPHILWFDGFEATTLLLSVVVMTYLISDGRSNYFEGLMLIGT
ncbi:Sodium/calcium exchanger membrane region [Penicillium italicum]|uniref:Sodium/calcium exchanger membrane region n=1 Tax=Penicillium italicum TaxID=40296 RepID=A0A0A2L686_PENIT|nr:Sodium/calcium exchanger membrane region [Penicillium italicum]